MKGPSRGIIKNLVNIFAQVTDTLADVRKKSNALTYQVTDALKSALAVFYFQHPSLLDFQNAMKKAKKHNNVERLFGVKNTPCTVEIKNIVDDVDPEKLSSVFTGALQEAVRLGIVDEYRVLEGGVLIPIDGVWYFSSHTIHCDHCLTATEKLKDGSKQTLYYHDVVAGAIAKPGCNTVLPIMPEFIRNEDGTGKQDCERNAAKRLLEKRGAEYKNLLPTFLGDDLYCCHEICKMLIALGYHFIFTCKDETHPWVVEQVANWDTHSLTKRVWDGRRHLCYQYTWANGIENRCDGERLTVNYFTVEVKNEENGKISYTNSWMTNWEVTEENVAHLTECGRCRWKIENEHNNVLKHRGYNLKHNFGHGKNHAAEVFCLLNLLGFLFHGIQEWADADYQAARGYYGRRQAFFDALRTLIGIILFDTWESLFSVTAGNDPDG
jgi:hypothetical protein